jgi:hypothetical protein
MSFKKLFALCMDDILILAKTRRYQKAAIRELILQRFVSRSRRLYEQGTDMDRLRRDMRRWVSWLWGGLDGWVSRKGGLKDYLVFVSKKLQISGVSLSRR